MRRCKQIVIGCLALLGLQTMVLAQAGAEDSTTSRLVAQNPVLADLARTNRPALERILRELLADRTGTQKSSDGRTGTWTTDAESAELDANPDFKLAFQRNPEATLKLLGEVDGILAEDPRRASQ